MDWTGSHKRFFPRLIGKCALLYTEMITGPMADPHDGICCQIQCRTLARIVICAAQPTAKASVRSTGTPAV